MAKTTVLTCTILCLLLSSRARADFYSCRDSAGHMVTSDRPIPECADRSTQVFKENGILKNQISTPQNEQQRKAAEILEQQRVRETQHQEDLKREHLFLVAHYPTEEAVEVARKKELDALNVKISAETRNIEAATTALNTSQKMLPNLPKNQPSKIRETQSKIEDMTQAIQESNRLIHNYRIEQDNVNQQFDATHKRYNELITSNKR